MPAKPQPPNAPKSAAAGGKRDNAAARTTRGRSELEQDYDRLRLHDRLEDGVDAIGPKGLQQLCADLGIGYNELEFYVLVWRMGATQANCITRSEWLHAVYSWRIDHLGNIKTSIANWVSSVLADEQQYTELYYAIYDFIRTDDEKLLPLDKALRAWRVLLPEPERFKFLSLWAQWATTEYKRAISRDLWRELWGFARKVKDINQYDVNDKWPTALDDFVEWVKERQKP